VIVRRRSVEITVSLRQLQEDLTVYPRSKVIEHNVRALRRAVAAGVYIPLIIVDELLRVIDGIHRRRAYLAERGPDFRVVVEQRRYESDAERLLDAISLNCSHGQNLSAYDRAKILLKAEQLEISESLIAAAMNLTEDALVRLVEKRAVCTVTEGTYSQGIVIPKRTILHMCGKRLSKKQVRLNESLSGQPQIVIASELVSLIETKLVDLHSLRLVRKLVRLRELLDAMEI
jgi:hypothetical protein